MALAAAMAFTAIGSAVFYNHIVVVVVGVWWVGKASEASYCDHLPSMIAAVVHAMLNVFVAG
jgi:hypothetical protein